MIKNENERVFAGFACWDVLCLQVPRLGWESECAKDDHGWKLFAPVTSFPYFTTLCFHFNFLIRGFNVHLRSLKTSHPASHQVSKHRVRTGV